MSDTLLDLTSDIVTAHVSNNSVSVDELPGLIKAVYDSLITLGQPVIPVEEPRVPAVSVRSSIKPHAITCLECGAKLKMLKRHLSADHDLTPNEYRARWNLPPDYPMVAADYAAKRAELALKIGLGRKPPAAIAIPEAAPKKVKAKPAKAKPVAAKKPRKKLGLTFAEPEAEAGTSSALSEANAGE